jgi:glutamate dehydrogenase (NAD(P)+)
MDGLTVIVLGFGKVGYHACAIFESRGAKIIGIADSKGALYNKNGIDITAVSAHKKAFGGFAGFKGADQISIDELLTKPVDVLAPSAIEGQIHKDNAGGIKAKIIAEGANNPVTGEANKILIDNGAFILPDILANAGGVVVSYFEWVQDLQRFFWTEAEINSKLSAIMIKAFHEVLGVAAEKKTDLRTAAMVLGVKKVAEAIMVRGLYP